MLGDFSKLSTRGKNVSETSYLVMLLGIIKTFINGNCEAFLKRSTVKKQFYLNQVYMTVNSD